MIGREISRITQQNQWLVSFYDRVLHQYTLEVGGILTVVTVGEFYFLSVVISIEVATPHCWAFFLVLGKVISSF